MQIKAADDPQPTIDELEALARRPDVDSATRRRIEQEIRRVRAGASGEREAAYEIEFHCGASKNQVTLHDLRLEVDGRVAQIDHLILNRLLDIWLLESKHFAEGVAINKHGEWEAFYNGRRQGIASPVEQNRKHIAVLSDVFSKGLVRLPTRLGLTIKPQFHSLVLVSSQARIERPGERAAAGVDGLDTVIKVDQLRPTLDRTYDQHSVAALGKVVGQETIERLAHELAALHRPGSVNWGARFGVPAELQGGHESAHPARSVDRTRAQVAANAPATDRPTCVTCGRRVSDAVVAYCQQRAARFGGAVFCMDCQKRVGQAKS